MLRSSKQKHTRLRTEPSFLSNQPSVFEGGGLVWNAERIEALLRPGSAAFSDVQLLPAAAFTRNRQREKPIRKRAPQSAPRVRISSCRLRGDAQSRASIN